MANARQSPPRSDEGNLEYSGEPIVASPANVQQDPFGLFSKPAPPVPYGPPVAPADSSAGDPAESNQGLRDISTTADVSGAVGASDDVDRIFSFDIVPGPRGPAGVPLSGNNWAGVGGQGQFSRAFEEGPEEITKGLGEQAAAVKDEGEQLAAHYNKQASDAATSLAASAARRAQDDQEILRREEELKQVTEKYTQNLSNNSSFWKSPTNIASAIAYAFMPLAGAAPGTGLKMIDQAVQSDWNNRRQLADMHLGELRSNLAGYRQIAKDRDAGDALALSEAYRVAALQVQAIGANFQGKKAQAAMRVMTGELMQKSTMAAMEFRRRLIYLQPHMESTTMAKEWMGQPGFERYGSRPGEAGTVPSLGVSAPPSVAVGPKGQVVSSGVGQAAQSGGVANGPFARFLRPGGAVSVLSPEKQERLESRFPGFSDLANSSLRNLVQRAVEQVGQKAFEPGGDNLVAQKVAAIREEAKNGVGKIETLNKDREESIASVSRFQQDLANLEAEFGGDKKKLNEFMGLAINFSPGANTQWDSLMAKMGVGSKNSQSKREAAMRLRQLMAGQVNAYFRETSGGAVTPVESERLKQVIHPGSSWSELRNFANDMSMNRGAAFRQAVVNGAPDQLSAVMYLVRKGQQYPSLDSPGRAPKKK